jgi:hypothetical protein
MTFRERQNRLTRLLCVLLALALVPLLMNLLDMGDFTPAGMTLYVLTCLAFAVPTARLLLQHARAQHGHQPGPS